MEIADLLFIILYSLSFISGLVFIYNKMYLPLYHKKYKYNEYNIFSFDKNDIIFFSIVISIFSILSVPLIGSVYFSITTTKIAFDYINKIKNIKFFKNDLIFKKKLKLNVHEFNNGDRITYNINDEHEIDGKIKMFNDQFFYDNHKKIYWKDLIKFINHSYNSRLSEEMIKKDVEACEIYNESINDIKSIKN